MELDTYYKLISSEQAARKYLSRKCRKNGHRFCPRCNWPMSDTDVPVATIRFTTSRAAGLITVV
jgi:hypothetical protein